MKYFVTLTFTIVLMISSAFASEYKRAYPVPGGSYMPVVSYSKGSGKTRYTALVWRYFSGGAYSTLSADRKGKTYSTAEEAAKAAHKAAQKMAEEENEAMEGSGKEDKKKFNLFKAISKIFKKTKKGEGVMLGPDGRADFGEFGEWGEWTFPKTGTVFLLPIVGDER